MIQIRERPAGKGGARVHIASEPAPLTKSPLKNQSEFAAQASVLADRYGLTEAHAETILHLLRGGGE